MRLPPAVVALLVTTGLALGACGDSAVSSGRILPIEYNYTGNSPRAVEGLEKLAEQLKSAG